MQKLPTACSTASARYLAVVIGKRELTARRLGLTRERREVAARVAAVLDHHLATDHHVAHAGRVLGQHDLVHRVVDAVSS